MNQKNTKTQGFNFIYRLAACILAALVLIPGTAPYVYADYEEEAQLPTLFDLIDDDTSA